MGRLGAPSSFQIATTFPGFMMFFGSSARLMVFIISNAPAPASSTR